MRISFFDISDDPEQGVLLEGAVTKYKGARSDRRSLLSLQWLFSTNNTIQLKAELC